MTATEHGIPEQVCGSASPGEDPHDLVCARCREHAPEFALGVLSGRENAEMLLHLQRCGHCQGYVRELAVTAVRLVNLVPEVQPPPGFAERVLNAIGAAANLSSRDAAAIGTRSDGHARPPAGAPDDPQDSSGPPLGGDRSPHRRSG